MEKVRDVVVIGGGAAGLSAALTLARARRVVSVVDAGEPRNAPAAAAHGLLGLDGVSPLELLARGRREVETYGGEIIAARVTGAFPEPGGFLVVTGDGTRLRAKAVVVATGVTDDLPAVPGLRERWRRDVVHCPYCHGWEIRDRRIGLLATGPMSALQALLFHQWSDRVVFFPQGLTFGPRDLAKLSAVGIPVVEGHVQSLEVTGGALSGVHLDSGRRVELDVLAVPSKTTARTDGLDGLGLAMREHPLGTSIEAEPSGRTPVARLWVAGNAVDPAMQVSEAAAHGARVGMTINTTLVFDDAERATAGMPAAAAAQGVTGDR